MIPKVVRFTLPLPSHSHSHVAMMKRAMCVCAHRHAVATGAGLPPRCIGRVCRLCEGVPGHQDSGSTAELNEDPGANLVDHLVPLSEPAIQNVAARGRG
mgnify:CR=1 FL=1|jgi:hypothetical protein